jgi:hypothetical protein
MRIRGNSEAATRILVSLEGVEGHPSPTITDGVLLVEGCLALMAARKATAQLRDSFHMVTSTEHGSSLPVGRKEGFQARCATQF